MDSPTSDHGARAQLLTLAKSGTLAQVTAKLPEFLACQDGWEDDSPIMAAAQHNADPAVFRVLLGHSYDAKLERAGTGYRDGYRLLHRFAERNWTSEIELMLALGAPLESRDVFGKTPLSIAVEEGSLAACEVLLRAGANPKAIDDGMNRPLHHARANCVPALVEAGAEINATNWQRATALHGAWDNPELRNILAQHGASMNAVDGNGETVLLKAAKAGDASAVADLLELGADPHYNKPVSIQFDALCGSQPGVLAAYQAYLARAAMMGVGIATLAARRPPN